MKRLLTFALLSACSSSEDDAQAPDLPVFTGAVVTQHLQAEGTTIPIAPTQEHALLVVVVGLEAGGVASVRTSTDRALERDFVTLPSTCGRGFEVWSAGDVEAGIDRIDIAATGPASIFVVEATGLSRFPLTGTQNAGSFGAVPTPNDPYVEAREGELVISSLTTCANNLSPIPGTFTAFAPAHGTGVAFQVAPAAGRYANAWSADGPTFMFLVAYR